MMLAADVIPNASTAFKLLTVQARSLTWAAVGLPVEVNVLGETAASVTEVLDWQHSSLV